MPQVEQIPDENALRAAFDAKVRRGIFKPVLRFLPVDIAEDRLQEAVCLTFEMYLRYAVERSVILDDALLLHHARLRAVDPNRFFVRNGGKRRIDDVMDWRNFAQGRVEVLHLDGIVHDDEDDLPGEGAAQLVGLASEMSISPARDLNSAIDLEAWLYGLEEQDRQLLKDRASGATLDETADDLGVSTSTVFAWAHQLGEELANRAGIDVEGVRRRRKRRSSTGGDGVAR